MFLQNNNCSWQIIYTGYGIEGIIVTIMNSLHICVLLELYCQYFTNVTNKDIVSMDSLKYLFVNHSPTPHTHGLSWVYTHQRETKPVWYTDTVPSPIIAWRFDIKDCHYMGIEYNRIINTARKMNRYNDLCYVYFYLQLNEQAKDFCVKLFLNHNRIALTYNIFGCACTNCNRFSISTQLQFKRFLRNFILQSSVRVKVRVRQSVQSQSVQNDFNTCFNPTIKLQMAISI